MSEAARRVFNRLKALPTEADVERGYFDARAITRDGAEVAIRLKVPSEARGIELIFKFHGDKDYMALLKALVAESEAALLDSLAPGEADWVANSGLCLCAGRHLGIMRRQLGLG